MSAPLPMGWEWSTLGEVCSHPQYGYTTSGATQGELKLLRTTDITSGRIDWKNVPFCQVVPEDLDKYLLRDGDILISRAGSVGVSFRIKNPEFSVFASYLIRFSPHSNTIDSTFLTYFLKSPEYWRAISENQLGIAIPNVNASKLREIPLPLPPLNEQRRIVAKLEALLSELEAAVAQLQAVQAQLSTYRQAVLKAAFEGRLTAAWRAQQPALPTADELLEQIAAARAEQAQATGKKRKPTAPLSPAERAALPELPEGWAWVRLGDYMQTSSGGTPSRKDPRNYKGSIPWIKSGELDDKEIYESEEHISDTALANSSAKMFPVNTILLALYGATIGKLGILKVAASTNQAICGIMPCSSFSLAFTFYALKSQRSDLIKKGIGGAQPNISQEIVRATFLPTCSLPEQHQIVREIESRLSLADQLAEAVSAGLRQAEALRQSLLKQAFSGRLVPQDATDEPASALLARLRTAAPAPRPTRRRAKTTKPQP